MTPDRKGRASARTVLPDAPEICPLTLRVYLNGVSKPFSRHKNAWVTTLWLTYVPACAVDVLHKGLYSTELSCSGFRLTALNPNNVVGERR